jgi:hypothetical protein
MGNKYTVQVWGQHWKEVGLHNESYSYRAVWAGESLIAALWNLFKARRLGFGCTTLEMR